MYGFGGKLEVLYGVLLDGEKVGLVTLRGLPDGPGAARMCWGRVCWAPLALKGNSEPLRDCRISISFISLKTGYSKDRPADTDNSVHSPRSKKCSQ